MKTLHIKAPAKINAYLEITGRCEDGYHTILTHMQAISLCDALTMTWQPKAGHEFDVRLQCSDPTLACDETNLVCRAARTLAAYAAERHIDTSGVLTVALQKNIPMAAGLAGGSADAAATLKGFNALLGAPLTTETLCELAVRLGADVPFCVRSHETSAMTARGIGEVLTPAHPIPSSVSLVVACHGEGVSTPWAYRKLDEIGLSCAEKAEDQYKDFLASLEKNDLKAIAAHTQNCFERVVLPEREAVGMLMEQMTVSGALFARMSGSGPSVVGAFARAEDANRCAKKLQEMGIRAVDCRPIETN